MIAFLLSLLFWVALADGMVHYYYPNIGIVPPDECTAQLNVGENNNDSLRHELICPVFHDGLACWNPNHGLMAYDRAADRNHSHGKNYVAVELFCPTVSHQLTTKVMRKYCGANGEWINPNSVEQNDRNFIDDSECYPVGVRPTADERKKLNKLTVKLRFLHQSCERAGLDSLVHESTWAKQAESFRRLTSSADTVRELPLTFRFDGIACYPVPIGSHPGDGNRLFIYQFGCPIDTEFFNPVSFNLDSPNYEQYGPGWIHCLRDEYKALLSKFGLAKYFHQGCATFENEFIGLPQTNFATHAYSPCSRPLTSSTISEDEKSLYLKSGRYNPEGKAVFFCNNLGMWEGSQDVFRDNQGCFSSSFKRVLDDMITDGKRFLCPVVRDDIFGQWPATQRGRSAKLSCRNVLKLFGMSMETTPSPYLNGNIPDISRRCNEQGKWDKIDWSQCLPTRDRQNFLEDLDRLATQYRGK